MTTQEGNKLINEFRGLTIGQAGYVNDYHISWNNLMPVVEKIRDLNFNFSIVSSKHDWSVYIIGDDGNLNCPYYSKLIDAAYTAVVQFIQWYNTQQKTK